MNPLLFTDHYELTMLDAALASGEAHRRCVFEAFSRSLPSGRRYGVVAGIGRLIEQIESLRFDDAALEVLRTGGVVSDRTLGWLADWKFTGSIWGFGEGEIYLPGSPVVVVDAPFAQAVILETLILSMVNYDSAIAGAASRMVVASRSGAGPDASILDMGARRTHEVAAAASARAAYICGFVASSDLAARAWWNIPTAGTAAHAFTLLHDDESAAFSSQIATLGLATTLLVDTYDIEVGINRAVEAGRRVGGTGPGAIRIDSGDPNITTFSARRQLDALGATDTRIVVSGDLDEFVIAELRSIGAPVDVYGVGTQLVTGSGAPTCAFVYKLVAREASPGGPLVRVAKRSPAKANTPGAKAAFRTADPYGERLVVIDDPRRSWPADALQQPLVLDGRVVVDVASQVTDARSRHVVALALLPDEAKRLDAGEPVADAALADADTHSGTSDVPGLAGHRGGADARGAVSRAGGGAVAVGDQSAEAAVRVSETGNGVPVDVAAKRALIVVDVQNDFCEGGSLAVAGGLEVARRIAEHLVGPERAKYDAVIATVDWHIDPGPHFDDNPDYVDSWPSHCVADSVGAQWTPSITTVVAGHPFDAVVRKGRYEAAYSGFEGLTDVDVDGSSSVRLVEWLRAHGIRHVDVCGIATDHCVSATARDAALAGFETTVLEDLCAAVDPSTLDLTWTELDSVGVQISSVIGQA